MKVAVACNGNTVAQHFGHCENFVIYNVEDKKIIDKNSIPNPGHRPGFLPNFLGDKGVNTIIAGGMGGGAVEIFNERNIEVIVGAAGDADKAVAEYANGNLQSTGEVCHAHEHEGHCAD